MPARPHHRIWPKRLPRQLVVPETTLWFNLEVSAARYPDKPAYLFFGRPLSYRALKAQAEAIAGWLQSVGVRAGERVAIFMQNCPQYAAAYYGILRANAVVVPVNPMNRAEEFAHFITDPQTRVVICSADLAGIVATANGALAPAQRSAQLLVTRYADAMPEPGAVDPDIAPPPAMETWLRGDPELPPDALRWSDVLDRALAPGAPTAQPDDLALLPYTSGTTGLPKGCMHTHRSLMSNAVGGGLWGHASAESVSLAVVPMFHVTGMMYGVVGNIYLGSTAVILPRWERELAGRLISTYQVTHWTCIPTMIIDLFGSPNCKRFDLTSLRCLSGGGAAMPQAVAQRLQDEFGLTFAEGYGLTETAAPTHANPPERAKLQCLGIPIFGVDARVIDPLTLQELPPGEVGEIITRGPMVFQGYWNHPEATRDAFVEVDGRRFFRTGDLGRMDEEGYFFMTDRLKRMINASGYKVWPAEVETLLYKHPAVQEACIVAARDAYRGETVKAVVVLRADATGKTSADDITNWARDHMAAYKVPTIVQFVDALPKSGSGKVMWRLLQDQEPAAASDAMKRGVRSGRAELCVAEASPDGAPRGPAVVCLHAAVCDKRMWTPQVDALRARHRVLAYDRRGFGETRGDPEAYSQVGDLIAVLDAAQIERAVLMGCSQGGRIAIDAALAHPQRVVALVLVACSVSGAPNHAGGPFAGIVQERIAAFEAAEVRGDRAAMNEIEAQLWLDGPTQARGRVGGALRELFLDMNGIALAAPDPGAADAPPPAWDRLAQIAVPTLVVWGTLDFEHLGARMREVARRIPGAQAVVIDGVAHLPGLERPAEFNRALLAFLESLPTQRPAR